MGFRVFMLICSLAIPLTMIGFGRLFLRKPPRSVNGAFGYRTARSMKNRDTWEFAHRYCGRVWQHCGWALLGVAIPVMAAAGNDVSRISALGGGLCLVQLAVLVGSILPTERALKRTFDEHGRRRNIP